MDSLKGERGLPLHSEVLDGDKKESDKERESASDLGPHQERGHPDQAGRSQRYNDRDDLEEGEGEQKPCRRIPGRDPDVLEDVRRESPAHTEAQPRPAPFSSDASLREDHARYCPNDDHGSTDRADCSYRETSERKDKRVCGDGLPAEVGHDEPCRKRQDEGEYET